MRQRWCRGLLPLFCCMFALFASPAHGIVVPPAVVESGSVIVTAETAEVREGPSRNAEVITVVERGEIFVKQGRTKGWYCIRLGEDAFGWISGRAIRRYQGEGAPAPNVSTYDGTYYPNTWGGYYPYSYFLWGQPYVTGEWNYYGGDRHRERSWERERNIRRDHDRDRPHNRTGGGEEDRQSGNVWQGGSDLRRGDAERGSIQGPRSSGSHFRGPSQRR